MKLRSTKVLLVFAMVMSVAAHFNPALAQLPKRDLTIEIRQVEEGREEGASYRAGPQMGMPWMESMKIQVRNGEKGTMRFNQSVPMQWVESAQAASAQSGATVRQALVWFDAGQTLSVLPRWSGGSNAPVVELEVHQSGMQDGMKADLPNQIHSRLASTVTAPLAQWVTVAASGGSAPKQGSYSSDSSGQARRLLQLRVLVP